MPLTFTIIVALVLLVTLLTITAALLGRRLAEARREAATLRAKLDIYEPPRNERQEEISAELMEFFSQWDPSAVHGPHRPRFGEEPTNNFYRWERRPCGESSLQDPEDVARGTID